MGERYRWFKTSSSTRSSSRMMKRIRRDSFDLSPAKHGRYDRLYTHRGTWPCEIGSGKGGEELEIREGLLLLAWRQVPSLLSAGLRVEWREMRSRQRHVLEMRTPNQFASHRRALLTSSLVLCTATVRFCCYFSRRPSFALNKRLGSQSAPNTPTHFPARGSISCSAHMHL